MSGEQGGEAASRPAPTDGPVVVLIGPPGAGKSTVGPLVAGLLGVAFLDTDSAVEAEAGKPVSDIFIQDGEPAFRELERAAAARAVAGHPGILALGSGAVMDEGTRRLLSGRRVVYLRAAFASVARRTGLDGPHPPMPGNPRGRARELLAERDPVYSGLAWLTVATDERTPQDIADDIAAATSAQLAADAGEGVSPGPADGAVPGPPPGAALPEGPP